MDAVQRLLDLEEIKTLEGRRNRFLDTQDWAALEAIHAPDIVSDAAGETPLTNARDMIAYVRSQVTGGLTTHHCHTPEIEFVTDHHARAVWGMEAMSTRPGADGRTRWRHAFGWYHVEYVRLAGAWKIKSRRHQRHRVDEREV